MLMRTNTWRYKLLLRLPFKWLSILNVRVGQDTTSFVNVTINRST